MSYRGIKFQTSDLRKGVSRRRRRREFEKHASTRHLDARNGPTKLVLGSDMPRNSSRSSLLSIVMAAVRNDGEPREKNHLNKNRNHIAE